jgi:hypothetical protein
MSDDYGNEPTDIAVAVHALRTFKIGADGKLGSLNGGGAKGAHWENGQCDAQCSVKPDDPDHVAPVEGCSCGIYGCLSLSKLFEQYGSEASAIVAVIAVEGRTALGGVGLKASSAWVIAYWRPADDPDLADDEVPGARRYFNLSLMARVYGLGE